MYKIFLISLSNHGLHQVGNRDQGGLFKYHILLKSKIFSQIQFILQLYCSLLVHLVCSVQSSHDEVCVSGAVHWYSLVARPNYHVGWPDRTYWGGEVETRSSSLSLEPPPRMAARANEMTDDNSLIFAS